jgi:hypothetical protein
MFPSPSKKLYGLIFKYRIKNNKTLKALFGSPVFNTEKSILTKSNQFCLNCFSFQSSHILKKYYLPNWTVKTLKFTFQMIQDSRGE